MAELVRYERGEVRVIYLLRGVLVRRLLAVVAVFVIALLGACKPGEITGNSGPGGGGGGDAAASTETKPSGPVAIGTPIKLDQGDGDLSTVTALTAEWKTEGAGNYPTKPKHGTYLVVDIQWEGKGSYNPLYIKFKSDTGQEYDAFGGIMSGYEPTLSSGDLNGEMVRGFVVFDVPQAAGRVIVVNILDKPAGAWSITA